MPTTTAPSALDTTWVVDATRSTLGFTIVHWKVATVKGTFGTFAGLLTADAHGALRAAGSVEVATLDSGNALRDRRLRGTDYLDAGRHPEIRFASRRIERIGHGRLRIAGDLVLKGAACPIELHARPDTATDDRLELDVTGELSRAALGITAAELGAASVSDTVKVSARLSLARAART
jgi:polyisoprenoid-binding protein YceI